MSERNKHIDDLFRDALGDHTETPPPAVWDALEQRLDDGDDGGHGGGSGSNNRPVFPYRWLWYIGVLLLLVGGGLTVWSVTRDGGDNAPANKITPASVQQPVAPATDDSTNENDNVDDAINGGNGYDSDINSDNIEKTNNFNAPNKKGTNNNKSNNTPNGRNTDSDLDGTTGNLKSNSNKSDGAANQRTQTKSTVADNISSTVANNKRSTNTDAQTVKPNSDDVARSKSNDRKGKVESTNPNNTPKPNNAVDPTVQKTASDDDDTAPKAQDQDAIADAKTNSSAQKVKTTNEPKDAIAKTQSKKENTKTSDPPKKEQQPAPKAQDQDADTKAKSKSEKVKATDKPDTKTDNKVVKTDDKPVVTKKDEDADTKAKSKSEKANEDDEPVAKKEPKKDDDPLVVEEPENKTDDKVAKDKTVADPLVAKKDEPKAKQQKQRKAGDLSAPPVTVEEEAEQLLDSAALDPFNNGGDLTENGDYKDQSKRKKRKVVKDKDDLKASKFEAGLNIGYEVGFDANRVDKYLVAPYVQYNLSDRSSLLFQPAYLMGMVKLTNEPSGESIYYDVTGAIYDSMTTVFLGDTSISPQAQDTIITNYTYSRTYDSTVVSTVVSNKQLWDLELPLMYQYKVSPNFSVFGGVSMTISKTLSITENRQDFTGFTDTAYDQWSATYPTNTQGPTPPAAQDPNSFFSNTGDPISSYQPIGSTTTTNTFTRWGYVIGFRATVRERFLIGASVQGKQVNTSIITNPELQKVYSQPYVRFTIGYKLFK